MRAAGGAQQPLACGCPTNTTNLNKNLVQPPVVHLNKKTSLPLTRRLDYTTTTNHFQNEIFFNYSHIHRRETALLQNAAVGE